MKLVIAIVQDYDVDKLLRSVTEVGMRATRLSSTGGFLRTGNTTIIMGIDNHRVKECLAIIQRSCSTRVDVRVDASAPEFAEWAAAGVHDVTIGGAVVFIVAVERFERIGLPAEGGDNA
ncbi:MAG TPA: cyclic-di-AMP receptor [Thermomicrobiales bacterium]|nr:cyclic-di-AMP receptor [Thermomicrobiales bacterium]